MLYTYVFTCINNHLLVLLTHLYYVLYMQLYVLFLYIYMIVYTLACIIHTCNISAYACAWHFYVFFAYNISFISIVNRRTHLFVLPLICIIYTLICVILCIYVYKIHNYEYYMTICMYYICYLHAQLLLWGLLHV